MKKTLYSLCAAFVMMIFMSSCGSKDKDIVILYTSDVFGRIIDYNKVDENEEARVSLANFATLVEETRRAKGANCIVLDNGNTVVGGLTSLYSNYVDVLEEPVCYRAMRSVGYDAISLGARDLDEAETLNPRRHDPSTLPDIICANLIDTRTNQPYFPAYKIFEREGLKICVLGMMTPVRKGMGAKEEWQYIRINTLTETVRHWMPIIREQENPDVMIALINSGETFYASEMTDGAEDTQARTIPEALAVEGFDAFLMGRSPVARTWEVKGPDGKNIPVIQPGANCYHAGALTIRRTTDEETGKPINQITGSVVGLSAYAPSSRYMADLKDVTESLREWANEKVCYMPEDIWGLAGLYHHDYYREILQRSMIETTQADIALAGVMAPRDTFPAGYVTMQDLMRFYPYGHEAVVFKMSGAELRNFLEYGAGLQYNHMQSRTDHLLALKRNQMGELVSSEDGNLYLNASPTNYISAFGIRYLIRVDRPVGQRIEILSLQDGSRFYPQQTYRVVMDSYHAEDGGNFFSKGLGWDAQTRIARQERHSTNSIRFSLYKYLKSIPDDTLRFSRADHSWNIEPHDWWREAQQIEWEETSPIW